MRALKQDNYTIAPLTKPSVQRILRVTDPVKRRIRLKNWLDRKKTFTQILFSLLTLAIASDRLALDKYGVFYVCKIARSQRATAVNVLRQQRNRHYLKEQASSILPNYQKEIRESTDCPPLVKREYRPNERATIADDLAVVYEDRKCEIPRRWVFKYVEGRALQRDTFQFTPHLTMPMVHAAIVLSHLSRDRDVLLGWARPLREETESRLRGILQCYRFDRNYLMISEDSCRSSIFAGLALYDFEHSQIHAFETAPVELSHFLIGRSSDNTRVVLRECKALIGFKAHDAITSLDF